MYSKIAEHISKAAPSSKTVLIDTFGGVGGNAIAFAISGRWNRVFAIEQDPQKIKCAKHNAEIYNVAGKIWWIQGDCFDILKKRFSKMGKEAVIFASPPWGGTFHYSPHRTVNENEYIDKRMMIRTRIQRRRYLQPRDYATLWSRTTIIRL